MNELTAQSCFGEILVDDGVIVIRHHDGGELRLPVAALTAVELENATVLTFARSHEAWPDPLPDGPGG